MRVVFIQNYTAKHSRIALLGSDSSSHMDVNKISGAVSYSISKKPQPLGKTLFTIQTSYEADADGRIPRVEAFLRLSKD